MKRADLIAALCLLLIFVLVGVVSVFAHDPGLSAADLKLDGNRLIARLSFARNEIAMLFPMDSDSDGQINKAEFDAALTQLESIAREALILTIGGKEIIPDQISVTPGESNTIHFNLIFTTSNEGRLIFHTPLIARLARGHRQFVTMRNEEGAVVAEKLLDANNNSFESDLAFSHKRPQTFQQFIKLGIEHILTGFDHLAFLLALLLVGSSFREAAKIITSFTVAHSITLALATLDLARLSPGLVEPLIALSIIYVGIENIIRHETKRRWVPAFGFGLIHGFGFASVLREIGIGVQGQGVLMPLFSFNLGVELGQIAIALLVLPLIWKLRKQPAFIARYIPACSILIALAGSYWLIQRMMLK